MDDVSHVYILYNIIYIYVYMYIIIYIHVLGFSHSLSSQKFGWHDFPMIFLGVIFQVIPFGNVFFCRPKLEYVASLQPMPRRTGRFHGCRTRDLKL